MLVTKRHLLTIPGYSPRPGFCRGGARKLAEAHGLDWQAFVRNGIAAEKLEATGDGFALALVKWARECEVKESAHGQE